MKIVDVSAFYAPQGGGVRTYVEQKIVAAADDDHELAIIVPSAENRVEQRGAGARIIHVASPTMPLDSRYRYFADGEAVHAILDAERPDLIEASSPWRTASIVANWQGDARRALIMHADPLAAYAYRWFGPIAERATIDRHFQWFWNHLRRNARRFDLVICANEGFSGRLRRGAVPNVMTVPMGIDVGIFSPERRDAKVRAELLVRCGLGPDAALLIGVGRHSAEKRWPLVIDACRRASLHRPIGLVLIGGGRDSLKIARHIDGNPHVHMLAPIADRAMLATVMASADALIHGCEAETFGLVAAEAAASGLPLIVPDEGGAADLVSPICGVTYTASNASAASAAILALLRRDPATVRVAARDHARTVGTMRNHFDRLFAAYRDLDLPQALVA
jgi:alpha-1,6-mannosyltransferase